MNIIQLGVCEGNDDLTQLVGNSQPDILILVEPLSIHNEKIMECYKDITNKHIENVAISTGDEEEISFFYLKNDWPKNEIASTDINHIFKHGYSLDETEEIKIKCLKINKLFEKYNLKKIDILFIDTEGIDDLIIKDIDFDSFEIDEIYFENLHITQDDIYEFLEKKGYNITKNWGYMGWTSFAKKK